MDAGGGLEIAGNAGWWLISGEPRSVASWQNLATGPSCLLLLVVDLLFFQLVPGKTIG
jgi:hypothetical protein